jgi:septal ring factor EnvC (AmiA/AmiB activator)
VIIKKEDIKLESAYMGNDFLDTLQAELSLQKGNLYEEFEQDKSVMQDRIKETESLYLEAGKNNKALLEKEQKYKQTIDQLDEKIKSFIADIEVYKKNIADLEQALKQTSFKQAEEIPERKLILSIQGHVITLDTNGTVRLLNSL